MKVFVDTSVWSVAFRRKTRTGSEDRIVQDLIELVRDLRVLMIGPVRQELLSGISDESTYSALQTRLSSFPDETIISSDYELAARLSNTCRRHGIQGSPVDFLVCAVSVRLEVPIFTTDPDFMHYRKHIPIELFPNLG